MKKCSTCGEVKSLDDFHNNKNSKDGKQNECKVCRNAKGRKEYNSLSSKEKSARGRRNNRKLIIEQLGGVCSYPGCNCTEDLQLDHINPLEKEYNISERLSSWDFKKLQPEIDKCQLLCPKHHLEKTLKDAKKYGYNSNQRKNHPNVK